MDLQLAAKEEDVACTPFVSGGRLKGPEGLGSKVSILKMKTNEKKKKEMEKELRINQLYQRLTRKLSKIWHLTKKLNSHQANGI